MESTSDVCHELTIAIGQMAALRCDAEDLNGEQVCEVMAEIIERVRDCRNAVGLGSTVNDFLSDLSRTIREGFADPVLSEDEELCDSCRSILREEFERRLSNFCYDSGRRPELLEWAISRWREEVELRPVENIHRRILDSTWRQVIRYAGGDDQKLVGQPRDSLDGNGLGSEPSEATTVVAEGSVEHGPR